MKLYRYVNVGRFKEMVDNSKLYFANPFIDWETYDLKEGYLYRYANEGKWDSLLDKPQYRYIRNQLKMGCLFEEDQGKELLDWFGMRCLCWCKTKCSPKMYEEYGNICFEIDSEDLLSLHYEDHKVEGMDVEYIDNYDIDRIIKTIGSRKEFYFSLVLRYKKKPEYEFEDEYRSYITLIDIGGHKSSDPKGILVNINKPISNFVKNVYLDNSMSDCDKKTVKEICDAGGIQIIA